MSPALHDSSHPGVQATERAVWHEPSELPPWWDGSVATIGVFDGFHRGHQALVSRTTELADELGLPSVLVTFDPHPLEVVCPTRAPRLITTLDERVSQALEVGITGVFVQQFDGAFAQIPASDWAEQFLVASLNVRAVVVGEDFRFGAGNCGDVETLRSVGARYGFSTDSVPLVLSHGQRCSSTRVRELHEAGRFAEARALLGR